MASRITGCIAITLVLATQAWVAQFAQAQHLTSLVLPEQKAIAVRDPAQLPATPIPLTPPPPTVAEWGTELEPRLMSLDEAIRLALANSQVVRVLAGVTAVSSGSTIYDTAAVNTRIDQERSRFDPRVQVRNSFNRIESPGVVDDPLDPVRAAIRGLRTDDYRLDVGVTKPTVTGGSFNLGVNAVPRQFDSEGILLNPETRSSLQMDFTQPLLQGGGIAVNVAPIVLARLDTERSFFQFKDSVQNLVRSVIEAYWALVFARTDLWTRDQQVKQLEQAYERTEAQFRLGIISRSAFAQTRVSLASFTAARIAARGAVLQREAALRNVLGLPPADLAEIIPTTPPLREKVEVPWEPLVMLAGERRPDIIELKLVLEADQQQLLLARNQALPSLDAVALYRWNGLEGETPTGDRIASRPGEFTDWSLGVNFSVPIGLRAERAALRQRELILSRDRANLEQGMHQVAHQLALNLRNLEQLFEQYEAFAEMRVAARENLEQQLAEYRAQRIIFLNVLLAITDWGNAVSSEAQSLLQYNSELANLELQTGTILETHGVRFFEERFGAIGPLGRCGPAHAYPGALQPMADTERYPAGDIPAENAFDLSDPLRNTRRPAPEPLPPPSPPLPYP